MTPWIGIFRHHRVVRASAAAIFLYGLAGAATSPYQSVIGIRELGLGDQTYAVIVVIASVTNVVLAIGIGALSDRSRRYRLPLIVTAGFGIIGYGMVWASPSAHVFAISAIAPLALFHATNSMLFGNVRAQSARFDPEERQIVNAAMRMAISLAWVLVPGAVGLALAGQDSMIAAYLIAAIASAGCLAVVIFGLERDHPAPVPATPPAGSVARDMAQVLHPALLLPVLGVALISQVLHVNGTVLPLILTGQAGGTPRDVGYVVGMVAALEVAFMFGWTWLSWRMRLTTALLAASALYLAYLAGLALATRPAHVYLASVIGGIGAAGIISLPISYLLDLIRDRPGLSASLIAVNMFLGGAIGAGIFGLGTGLQGYASAAIISGLAGVAGAGILIWKERRT
ncbi:MAG: MFS transporter [Paracoccus sp. (in: a-proteobacteria)]|nr:MFS transporter [Paracoccus sp. (in: a-proteobacteria)]